MRNKTHNRPYRGIFLVGQDSFDPQIVLRAAKGNFGVKNWTARAFHRNRYFTKRGLHMLSLLCKPQVHKISNVVCLLCCICVSGFRYDRRQDDQLGQNSRQHRHAFLSCSLSFILSSSFALNMELLLQQCPIIDRWLTFIENCPLDGTIFP